MHRFVSSLLRRPRFSILCRSKTDIAHAFNYPRTIASHRGASQHKPLVGPFGIKELTTPDGFQILFNCVANDAEDLLVEALQPRHSPPDPSSTSTSTSSLPGRKMVQVFDDLSDTICQVADMSECLRLLHPSREFRESAEALCLKLQELVEQLNTHRALYEAVNSVLEASRTNPQVEGMDEVDRLVLEAFVADFHLSGIHLEDAQRQQFVKDTQQAFELGSEFSRNALQSAGLPPGLIQIVGSAHLESVFPQSEDGRWLVLSHAYSDSPDPLVRQIGYRVYYHENEAQEKILMELMQSRYNVARHSGFSSFADRATRNTLGESHAQVEKFLTQFCERLKPLAEEEVNCLRRMLSHQNEVHLWDLGYGANWVRNQHLPSQGRGGAELRHYFSLGACMHGVHLLGEALFGIQLKVAEDVLPGELWHPSVIKLNVQHETEGHLGVIYCDFFDRPDRPLQDCHYTVRGGRRLRDGSYQSPVVVLQLHVGPYPESDHGPPLLLNLGGVENLFHEFGHALHSMLGRTRYQHVTGTRCSTDFAEVPSTLLEKFAFHPVLLREYARHWKPSGTESVTLSQEWAEDVHKSRELMHAAETLNHTILALTDQALHGPVPQLRGHASTTQLYHEIHDTFHPLKSVSGSAFHHRFTHFVNYGGRYYSYFMAQAVANLLWRECFLKEPLSRSAGEKYRRRLLAFGGERPSRSLVESVIGRPLKTEEMMQSLLDYFHEHRKLMDTAVERAT